MKSLGSQALEKLTGPQRALVEQMAAHPGDWKQAMEQSGVKTPTLGKWCLDRNFLLAAVGALQGFIWVRGLAVILEMQERALDRDDKGSLQAARIVADYLKHAAPPDLPATTDAPPEAGRPYTEIEAEEAEELVGDLG